MIFTKNRGLGGAGYSLAGHPQAELTMQQVNNLYDLALMIDKGALGSAMQIQRFKAVIPAGSTTDVTFTDTVDVTSVIGGYVEIYDVDGDYDFDVGHSNDTNGFVDDLNAGAVEDAIVPVIGEYIATTEDVVLTINSNSNTVPVTVYITLLTTLIVNS